MHVHTLCLPPHTALEGAPGFWRGGPGSPLAPRAPQCVASAPGIWDALVGVVSMTRGLISEAALFAPPWPWHKDISYLWFTEVMVKIHSPPKAHCSGFSQSETQPSTKVFYLEKVQGDVRFP